MADQADDSDADEGLSLRIRQSAAAQPPAAAASPAEAGAGRSSAERMWTVILADYVGEARRQEQVSAAYLEAQLGMTL